jgi:nucleotide-binding universal stress UspA family protein
MGESMYKKVLFPTDFSRDAGHALSHALKLTGVRRGELIVQHVITDYFERLPHWTTIFDVHELQDHVDSWVACHMKRIVEKVADSRLEVHAMISKGKPAEEILAASEDEMVDLIVLGPSTGAITRYLIERGSRPVMTVPSEETDGKPCRKVEGILAVVDFSHRSQTLVDHVFRLHASLGVGVHLLHVIEASCGMEAALQEADFSASLSRMREWALNQLVNLTPTEFVTSPKVHRVVELGRPSDVIQRVAMQTGTNLVVVGAQDRGLTERQLIGTTAERVLKQAGATILALPT